jgi:hypothetical protein
MTGRNASKRSQMSARAVVPVATTAPGSEGRGTERVYASAVKR